MAALKLEVFETSTRLATGATIVMESGVFEETRLESYDAGYSAGWEDAVAAQADEQSRIRADLARNIQTLGFSYHEARMHVLRAIEPLLHSIVGQLLPVIARETLAHHVMEILMPQAAAMADAPITLVINPAARPAVESLLDRAKGLPLTIVDEPTLSEGQVYLRLGDTETRVDLGHATTQIAAALRGFFDLSGKDRKYG